jgi:ribosomal protein L3
MANGEGHGQNGQPKRHGYADQTDPHVRKGRRQNGAAASAKDKPKGANELGS